MLVAALVSVSCQGVDRTEVGYTGYYPRDAGEQDFTRLTRSESIKALDLNQDNVISREEWEAGKERRKEPKGDFNKMDKDEDGQVSTEEVFEFVKDRVKFGSINSTLENDTPTERARNSETEPRFLQLNLLSFPLK